MRLRKTLRILTCLLLALISVQAHAQFIDYGSLPKFAYAIDAGTSVVLTRGERQEFAVARATLTAPAPWNMTAFARSELAGTQDGGSISQLEPSAFRSLEVIVGMRRQIVGPISVGPIFGVTYSAEGKKDAPLQNRHYTIGGTVSGHYRGAYLHLGVAEHDPVGGGALVTGLSVPTSKAVASLDLAYPFARDPLGRRSWQVRLNATVRVKDSK